MPRQRAQVSRLATAAEKKDFKVAWSIYVGWMPWGYAADSGIVKKWADKYGITIEVKQMDYIESINQYTAGAFDAVTLTNMDALSIPAAGGVDTTAVIVGDYSNGNDAIILKGKSKLDRHQGPDRQPRRVLGVSLPAGARARKHQARREGREGRQHLGRGHRGRLQDAGSHRRRDLEADGLDHPRRESRCEGSLRQLEDPGEIIDMMVANTDVLKDNPKFGKALAGIWYETVAELASKKEAKEHMAKASGTDIAGFDEQLATTKLFATPKEALAFTEGADIKAKNELVAKFLFDKALLGKDAKSAGAIGIEFPDKSVFGDKANVKLRYDATFMKEAGRGSSKCRSPPCEENASENGETARHPYDC